MKTRFGIFSALVILALISLVGIGAAESYNGEPAVGAAHFVPRPSDDLNAPAPIPGDGNWTRNWTGNMTPGTYGSGEECDETFGPGSPFYGLKLGFEDLDETFTFNETERIEKQIQHGDNRLSELECELERNQTRNLDRILERYWDKMNQTEDSLRPIPSNETGLLHAREMIQKHQGILQNLSEQNPDNQGLAKAYNNSQKLQNKFDEKIRMRYNLSADGNTTMMQQQIENGKSGKGTGNDKTPPGQQKQQDQQSFGTASNQSQDTGTVNNQKDKTDQKQTVGNSQKDKGDQNQDNGKGKTR